ncbi:hypothetical protein EC988_004492 [Linderina pennispora]|nr:hypothetical protein EC988_004492 [Linderina pennispora]
MHSLKRFLSLGYSRSQPKTEPPANYIDMYDSDDNATAMCMAASCRPADNAQAKSSSLRRKPRPWSQSSSGGISWQDVEAEHAPESACSGRCKFCNISVAPESSLVWHERMCGLGKEAVPTQCELCHKSFRTEQHARNHYLYGCTAA